MRALLSRKYVAISAALAENGLRERLSFDGNRLPMALSPPLPLGGGELADSAGSEEVPAELLVGHRLRPAGLLGRFPRLMIAEPGPDLLDHILLTGIAAALKLGLDQTLEILTKLDIHRTIPPFFQRSMVGAGRQ